MNLQCVSVPSKNLTAADPNKDRIPSSSPSQDEDETDEEDAEDLLRGWGWCGW